MTSSPKKRPRACSRSPLNESKGNTRATNAVPKTITQKGLCPLEFGVAVVERGRKILKNGYLRVLFEVLLVDRLGRFF
jgi:hypothetical protein